MNSVEEILRFYSWIKKKKKLIHPEKDLTQFYMEKYSPEKFPRKNL